MTNIYILSKRYHVFVLFCSLFIGRQKKKKSSHIVAMYTRINGLFTPETNPQNSTKCLILYDTHVENAGGCARVIFLTLFRGF